MDEIEKVAVSDITVDQLMDDAAAEIKAIDAKAEFTLSVVTQSVKTQANISKGYILRALRAKVSDGIWMDFLKRIDIGISHQTALDYIRAADIFDAASANHDQGLLLGIPSSVLSRLSSLPQSYRDDLINDFAEGKPISRFDIEDLRKRTEVKLAKAEDKLSSANQRLREASNSREDSNARRDVKRHADKVRELEEQLSSERRLKEEAEETLSHQEDQLAVTTTKLNAVQEELDKMKFDDEISVGLMVKRTGYNLQNMVPQVLADVQRFHSARDRFPDELSNFLEDNILQLYNYLKQHYDN